MLPQKAYATTADALPEITLATELSSRALVPVYKPLAADSLEITDISTNTANYLDNAYTGTATATTSTLKYWSITGSKLNAHLTDSSAGWESYQSGTLSASYSTTTTLDITQTYANGVATTTKILKLILTATGTPAALTSTVLLNFMRGCAIKTFAASATGTALTSTSALTSGWAAKMYLDNSGTAAAATLDPIEATYNYPITPYNSTTSASTGTASTFTATVPDLHTWNVQTSATTAMEVIFGSNYGSVTYNLFPAKFGRTVSVSDGIIAALTSPPSKRLTQSNTSFLQPLETSTTGLGNLVNGSSSASIQSRLNTAVFKAISGAGMTDADFTTKDSTTDWGLVTYNTAKSNLTSGVWSVDNSSIVFTAQVGASGKAKAFSYDLSGLGTKTITDASNSVIQLTALDGDALFVKYVNGSTSGTGIDGTTVTSGQANQLAILMMNALTAVATVAYADLDTIITAAVN